MNFSHYFQHIFTACDIYKTPVPVAARSTAQVYGRSPAEIVGSNPTGGMDVCLLCCVLSGRGLCDEMITRPEESYRLWCDLDNIITLVNEDEGQDPLRGYRVKRERK